jgi:hypothetical protein
MSTTAKIILIAFGSMIALLVALVAIFAFIILPRLGGQQTMQNLLNPEAAGSHALVQMGFHRVPPGYHAMLLSNFGQSNFGQREGVLIMKDAPFGRRRSQFMISVMQMNVPSLTYSRRLACKTLINLHTETVRARAQDITLHHYRCDSLNTETTTASIVTPRGFITVKGNALSGPADMVAIRQLLASFWEAPVIRASPSAPLHR